jgi:hypothetical protein
VRVLDDTLLGPRGCIFDIPGTTDTPAICMLWSELDGRTVDFGEVQFGEAGPPLSALVCGIHMQAALRKADMYGWITKVRRYSLMFPCSTTVFMNTH